MTDAPARLDAASDEQLAALLRGLRRLKGFGLYVVIADGSARAELLRRLSEWGAAGLIPTLHRVQASADGVNEILRQVAADEAAPPWHGAVVAHETLLAQGGAALQALHLARDRLWRFIDGPLIFVVAPGRAAEVERAAADLMRIRRSSYVLNSEPIEPDWLDLDLQLAATVEATAATESVAQLHQRDQTYRALAGEVDAAAGPGLVDRWLAVARQFQAHQERVAAKAAAVGALAVAQRLNYAGGIATAGYVAGELCAALGQPEEGLRLLREVAEVAALEVGAVEGVAVVRARIADILAELGQFDEALRLYRDEVLPIFEQHNSLREIAVTLGHIAWILQQTGRLDEALRIRVEQLLPACDRLGDARMRAMASCGIAGILAQRGERKEALRMLLDEALPAFDRPQDQESRAVTLSKVAELLQDLGQYDDAILLLRNEVLPVYQRLGAARNQAVARSKLAMALALRGRPEDRAEVKALLSEALAIARRLQMPEARKIELLFGSLLPGVGIPG